MRMGFVFIFDGLIVKDDFGNAFWAPLLNAHLGLERTFLTAQDNVLGNYYIVVWTVWILDLGSRSWCAFCRLIQIKIQFFYWMQNNLNNNRDTIVLTFWKWFLNNQKQYLLNDYLRKNEFELRNWMWVKKDYLEAPETRVLLNAHIHTTPYLDLVYIRS